MGDWTRDAQRWVVEATKDIRQEAEDAARVWAEAGRDAMRQQILDAETPWGQKRVAEGRQYAGRYERGTLYDAVDATPPQWVDQDTVEARFGWPEGELRPSFLEQEYNLSGRLANAMHSLNVGATVADDALDGRLR